jgi:hypothetical protein
MEIFKYSPGMIRMIQVREDEMGTNGGGRNAYKIFVAKPEGKIPLGRPRRR